MRRLLLALVLGGPVALALLVLLAGLLGQLIGPAGHPFGSGDRCALPCWNGIRPGELYIPRASQILVSLGYDPSTNALDRTHVYYTPREGVSGCHVRLEHFDAIVSETRLTSCAGLRLGDVMAALGPPDGVQPGMLLFAFRGGQVRVKLAADGCAPRLSPYLPVDYLSLSAGPRQAGIAPWNGFMSTFHYLLRFPGVVLLSC